MTKLNCVIDHPLFQKKILRRRKNDSKKIWVNFYEKSDFEKEW